MQPCGCGQPRQPGPSSRRVRRSMAPSMAGGRTIGQRWHRPRESSRPAPAWQERCRPGRRDGSHWRPIPHWQPADAATATRPPGPTSTGMPMAKKATARTSMGWPNSNWKHQARWHRRPWAAARRCARGGCPRTVAGENSAWYSVMMANDTSIQPTKPCSVSPNQPPSVFCMIQALSTKTKYGSAPRSKAVTTIAASQAVSSRAGQPAGCTCRLAPQDQAGHGEAHPAQRKPHQRDHQRHVAKRRAQHVGVAGSGRRTSRARSPSARRTSRCPAPTPPGQRRCAGPPAPRRTRNRWQTGSGWRQPARRS
jgi:hypothetical protein